MPRPAVVCVAAVLATLTLAARASAHIVPTPGFLPSGSARSIELTGPNERDDTMTGFRVTVPQGLVIEHAHDLVGWRTSSDDSTAEWKGGLLGTDIEQSFGVTLRADTDPGTFELTAEQLYADGAVASWPVAITVTPAEASPSQNALLAGVLGLLGVLVIAAVALVAWRRRLTYGG